MSCTSSSGLLSHSFIQILAMSGTVDVAAKISQDLILQASNVSMSGKSGISSILSFSLTVVDWMMQSLVSLQGSRSRAEERRDHLPWHQWFPLTHAEPT